jgi:hypothetical protein
MIVVPGIEIIQLEVEKCNFSCEKFQLNTRREWGRAAADSHGQGDQIGQFIANWVSFKNQW